MEWRSPTSCAFLGRAADRIIDEVRGIDLVYDITSKPPGAIEGE